MNRDPFDTLRAHNPTPRGTLPEAPMALARRITAGRPSLRRGLAIAAAAAAAVLVAGGGWLLWSRTGGRQTVVGPPETTSTTAAQTLTTVPVEDAPTVVVYFLDANRGSLVPVARDLSVLNVRPLPDLGPLTMSLLLWGPGAWDAGPLPDPVATAEAQLTTAIPEGTELLGLTISDDGTARVDLSGQFASASSEALAQVVFTLTRIDGVTGVSFSIDGLLHAVSAETLTLVPAGMPSDEAPVIDPATRLQYQGLMGAGIIEAPPLGGILRSPGMVAGFANSPEPWVSIVLVDADGTTLWEAPVEASCGTPWGPCRGGVDWSTYRAIAPPGLIDHGRWGTLSAYLHDPAGELIPLRSQPVWLEPLAPYTDEPAIPAATTTSGSIGLGELRPFPAETLSGCAAETARDLAAFEAALAPGPLSLEALCAVVGPPDWETGSGLMIAVYDLAGGGWVLLGYAGPADLVYATWQGPTGEQRSLVGE